MKIEKYLYTKGYRVTELGIILNPNNIELNPYISNRGYYRLNVRVNKKIVECSIHRLQAYQKYGESLYNEAIEVRHLDGNKLNNSYENIVIGNHKENCQDIPESIRIARSIYAASFNVKHNKIEIQAFYKECKSYKKTMERFNISSKGTLYHILNK